MCLPLILEIDSILFIKSEKDLKSIGCSGSTAELLGSGCTSNIILSAPAAILARVIGATHGRQKVACEGSTAMGKWVISFAAGITCRSKRNLEAVSYTHLTLPTTVIG